MPTTMHSVAHHVWQGLLDVERNKAGVRSIYTPWVYAYPWRKTLEAAHKFAFREIRDDGDDVLADFGASLVTRGLFRLPFESTFFEWPDYAHKGQTNCVIVRAVDSGGTGLPIPENGYSVVWLAMSVAKVDGTHVCGFQDGGRITSFDDGSDATYDSLLARAQGANAHIGGFATVSELAMARSAKMHRMTINEILAALRMDAGLTVRFLLEATASLMSRGIKTERHETSAKVNAARQRAGKPPFFSYSVVTLDKGFASVGGRQLNGSRSGPRLHWRRGHIRSLADGRLVPISPCLVGSSEFGTVIKDYQVNRMGMAQ